jgi:ABC-type glycerol-3-phosphate transport system permease component
MTKLTQVGLVTQIEQLVILYRQLWAFITLTIVPVIIFYIFAERQIVSGFTAGAM